MLVTKLLRSQPAFMSTFAIVLLDALKNVSNHTSSNNSSSKDNFTADMPSSSALEELYAWLSRNLTSQLYRRPSEASTTSCDTNRVHEQIVSECLLAPTPATVRLAHDIVRCNSPPFQRTWAPAVNACLPLLLDWEPGPDRISGNGSNVKQLEAIDVPAS